MKAVISKNYKFIQLSEKPTKAEVYGFKLTHKYETQTELPISSTHLIAGKLRYYLKVLPKEARESIHKIEIKKDNIWISVPFIDKNILAVS